MPLEPDAAAVLAGFRAADAPPLRVGLVFDGPQPPVWVGRLAAFLAGFPQLAVTAFDAASPTALRASAPSAVARGLLELTRRTDDPFAPGPALPGRPATGHLAAADCELLVWLAARRDGAPATRCGALSVTIGERAQSLPLWDEVNSERVTTRAAVVWHETSLARGRIVREVETTTTSGLRFTQNASEPLAAVMRLVAELCLDFRAAAAATAARMRRLPEEPLASVAPAPPPSAAAVLGFIGRKLVRSTVRRYTERGRASRWFVALRRADGRSVLDREPPDMDGFRELALVGGSTEMADPFLYEHEGATYLLFEDVPAGSAKGRLASVRLLDDGRAVDHTVLLDLPYHLSYPCVFESGGHTYLIPESTAARRVDLYRFERFPRGLARVATLVEGVGLVDSTPVCVDGQWYLFSTTSQPFMETVLFTAPRLEGPWRLHPASPLSSSVRSSRSAGHLFRYGGRLYRPTQDCSVHYGYAMTVNEVLSITPTEYAERPATWIGPSWAPRIVGTHTLNTSTRWQVVDGIRKVPVHG